MQGLAKEIQLGGRCERFWNVSGTTKVASSWTSASGSVEREMCVVRLGCKIQERLLLLIRGAQGRLDVEEPSEMGELDDLWR